MGIWRIRFLLGIIILSGGLLILICSIIEFLPAGLIGGPMGVAVSIPTSILALWLFVKVVKDTVRGKEN